MAFVDHDHVSAIIQAALKRAKGGTVRERIESAWDSVNERRLAGDCGIDLAAAEHYLYARHVISSKGWKMYTQLKLMQDVYTILKYVGITYKEGTCQPAPPSREDWEWTRQGIEDGLADYFGRTEASKLNAPRYPEKRSLP